MKLKPTETMSAGVVLERRKIDNPWQDYAWQPVAVIPGAPPRVFVVLRPDEEDEAGHDVIPFLVTVCPFEAQDYDDTDEEMVGGVPMPDEVIAWVQDFIDEHHVDVPFKKRKREPYDPRRGGFARNPRRGGSHG